MTNQFTNFGSNESIAQSGYLVEQVKQLMQRIRKRRYVRTYSVESVRHNGTVQYTSTEYSKE